MKTILKIFRFYFNTLAIFSPGTSGKHAFHLFGFPFKAKLKDAHQKFLKTAVKFELEVNGKNIQGYRWGVGSESILFVHGWQSNTYRWKSFIESFDQEKYTLYSFDAPGHGNSGGRICTVPLYEKTIEAMIDKVGSIDHFIGHSIGSFACSSFFFYKNYTPKTYVSLASPNGATEFIAEFQKRLKLSKKAYKNLLTYFEQYIGSPATDYLQEIFCKEIAPKATLIIHDKNDKSTSFENSVRMEELLRLNNQNVELILTEGYKHNLRSGEVVDRVVNFVSESSMNSFSLER